MVTSEKIDLGLPLPGDFDLESIFPHDRLLRLHPNWFIFDFRQNGIYFTANIKDYVSEKTLSISGSFAFNREKKELLHISLIDTIDISIKFLNLDNRLKVWTRSPSEIDPNDPLLLWIRAIREYIRLYTKKTPVTLFFRLVMNRMVLQMNPSQRKICLMLARITFVEILAIIFIVVGYVIFVL